MLSQSEMIFFPAEDPVPKIDKINFLTLFIRKFPPALNRGGGPGGTEEGGIGALGGSHQHPKSIIKRRNILRTSEVALVHLTVFGFHEVLFENKMSSTDVHNIVDRPHSINMY